MGKRSTRYSGSFVLGQRPRWLLLFASKCSKFGRTIERRSVQKQLIFIENCKHFDYFGKSISDHDGAEPCGNSVSARNLPLISAYFHDKSYKERACKLLQFFSSASPFGYALPEMFSAQLLRADSLAMMVIVGMYQTVIFNHCI